MSKCGLKPRVSENPGVGLALQTRTGMAVSIAADIPGGEVKMGRRHRPVVDAFFPTWYEVTLLPRQVRRADRFDLTCWVRGASASGRRAAHQANRRGTSGKGHRPVVDAPFRGAVRGHTSAAPGEEWADRFDLTCWVRGASASGRRAAHQAIRRGTSGKGHRPVVDAPFRGAARGHTSTAPGEERTVRCSICACRRRGHRPVVDAPYARTGRFAW